MIILHASALNRAIACNGSVAMAGLAPAIDEPVSEDRREGTAAHHVAASVLNGEMAETIEYIDRRTPNGVYVTPEMAEFVEPYVTAIQTRGMMHGCPWHAEPTVDFQLTPEVFIKARADCIMYDSVTKTLFVDSFKYGWKLVEPERNWTELAYAIGWIMNNHIAPDHIVITVHQPRPFHPEGRTREWRITYETLHELWTMLQQAIGKLSDTLETGSHCYECPALAICEAARKASMNTIEASGRVFNDTMPDDAIEFEMINLERAQEMLKQRLQALEDLATHRARSNSAAFKEYSLEMALGKRRWNDGLTPELISALVGKDVRKPDTLTPRQVEKLGVSEDVIAALVTRPQLGLKLVRKSKSKRAERLFGKDK